MSVWSFHFAAMQYLIGMRFEVRVFEPPSQLTAAPETCPYVSVSNLCMYNSRYPVSNVRSICKIVKVLSNRSDDQETVQAYSHSAYR
jgi:hypothetical protein